MNYLVIENNARPFQIETNRNPLQGGIITDIVKAIFAGSSYKINVIVAPRQRLLKTRSSIANWISFDTHENKITLRDQIKLFDLKSYLITLKESGFRYNSLDDLFNKKLILLEGSRHEGLDKFIGLKLTEDMIFEIRAPAPSNAVLMLAKRRGIGYVDYELRAKYYIRMLGMSPEDFGFNAISEDTTVHGLYLTMDSQMNKSIKQFVFNKINKMAREGTTKSIVACYINAFRLKIN